MKNSTILITKVVFGQTDLGQIASRKDQEAQLELFLKMEKTEEQKPVNGLNIVTNEDGDFFRVFIPFGENPEKFYSQMESPTFWWPAGESTVNEKTKNKENSHLSPCQRWLQTPKSEKVFA